MNLQVQFYGSNFNNTDVITTNSSDIAVGPVIVTDAAGDLVAAGGVVLSTTFFINATASAQNVEITFGTVALSRTFEIIIPGANSGDYIGQGAGPHSLGDGIGRNGDRTIGGTIVLENLLIPVGTIVNVTTTDISPTEDGNQGYLPAVILVTGDVQINGTLLIDGQDGFDYNAATTPSQGGYGGPGGGGGAGGGNNDGNGFDGGAGFTGGGGGGNGDRGGGAAEPGGTGGNGTGAAGDPNVGFTGGDGGGALYGSLTTEGRGGERQTDDGTGACSGSGGTGFAFGTQAQSCQDLNPGPPAGGNGGGGGGGTNSEGEHGGGGGFGTVGAAGDPSGNVPTEQGLGGAITGNTQLVPLTGGSGGGGGSGDTGGAPREGGGGGGGAGSLLIFAKGSIETSGAGQISADGGNGGIGFNPSAGAGGGGAGSGGGIVLQSSNVTLTAGGLSAAGGTGGTGGVSGDSGTLTGGDGGEGRWRVDGLDGVTTIPGVLTSEYVGPAITDINGTHVIGRGAVGATVNATISSISPLTSFTDTVDVNGDFAIPVDFIEETNYVTVIQNTTALVFVMSSAATWIVHTRTMEESVAIDDSFSKKVFISIEDGITGDSVTLVDIVSAKSKFPLDDAATVDDFIVAVRLFQAFDAVTIDDTITFNVFYQIEDSVTIDDSISKVFLKEIEDSISADDLLMAKTLYSVEDSATVDDLIMAKSFIQLVDGTKAESVTTADKIFKKTFWFTEDSATVEDTITMRVLYSVFDTVSVDDLLMAKSLYFVEDSVTIEDEITILFIGFRDTDGDTVNIDDTIITESSIGSITFLNILSATVTASPFMPSVNLMNTLIEIVSSIVTESNALENTLIDIDSSIIVSGFVSLNNTDIAVILSSIDTESSRTNSPTKMLRPSTVTESNTS